MTKERIEYYENQLQTLQSEIDATTYLGTEIAEAKNNIVNAFFTEVQASITEQIESYDNLSSLREYCDTKIERLNQMSKETTVLTSEMSAVIGNVKSKFRDRMHQILNPPETASEDAEDAEVAEESE